LRAFILINRNRYYALTDGALSRFNSGGQDFVVRFEDGGCRISSNRIAYPLLVSFPGQKRATKDD
jgi:hypothetical protein